MTRLDRNDRLALNACIEQARKQSPERAEQIDDMMRDKTRTWFEVSTFAARCCQSASLNLEPWRSPPCILEVDGSTFHSDADGEALLRKMLAAGVSRYHPSPLTALEAAKAAKGNRQNETN